MDSYDDCFDDIDEPLYGYAVKLRLKDEEPCNFSACLAHLNNTHVSPKIERRNDEINLVSTPDCKVKNVCG